MMFRRALVKDVKDDSFHCISRSVRVPLRERKPRNTQLRDRGESSGPEETSHATGVLTEGAHGLPLACTAIKLGRVAASTSPVGATILSY